jgi:AraC family transcriptional activator of pobA
MADKEVIFKVIRTNSEMLTSPQQFSFYTVIFITSGEGIYHADFGRFPFVAPVMLFSTPLQQIYIEQSELLDITMIQFHGDFYCIEYHRAEVACNGLLFNNCNKKPEINLENKDCELFKSVLKNLEHEFTETEPNETVIRAFLQLWLAKASSIKIKALNQLDLKDGDDAMEKFRTLINQNYLTMHKPSEYARLLNMSPNNLTKRCTKYFNKTPSQLITERLILEAKRQLHLTYHSIKEIAYNLKFMDEYYFSRVFKKHTQISPMAFREKTGISIVANLPHYQQQ